MAFHFCSKTGARIVAPGVSKSVDPVNGQDEVVYLELPMVVETVAEGGGEGGGGEEGEEPGTEADISQKPKAKKK